MAARGTVSLVMSTFGSIGMNSEVNRATLCSHSAEREKLIELCVTLLTDNYPKLILKDVWHLL